MGPQGLAKRLKCDIPTARSCLDKFEKTYPNDMAYRRMIVSQIALTGRVATFMGRDRTDTAHRWLVALPRVRIMVSFKGPRYNRYWLDVTPLRPNRHTLTCYIHQAWDAAPGRHQGALIYDASQGCLTQRDYHLYDTTFLEYRLPIRNFGWRSIRRVRALGEEAKYRGLDSVTRALFNAVCQGGTADLTKLMMLGISPTLERFGARLLLQIHDELVFEVPESLTNEFISTVVPELEGVVPKFAVPIILEPKYGTQFGDMRDMEIGVTYIITHTRTCVIIYGTHPPAPLPTHLRLLQGLLKRTDHLFPSQPPPHQHSASTLDLKGHHWLLGLAAAGPSNWRAFRSTATAGKSSATPSQPTSLFLGSLIRASATPVRAEISPEPMPTASLAEDPKAKSSRHTLLGLMQR